MNAPIAFFAFNRPGHTARTLAALAANPEAKDSDLHVFVDGPRHEAERALVKSVVREASSSRGFGSVDVVESKTNRGLFESITAGVSSVVGRAGRVIVVEDDILVAPFFLKYMNDALNRYSFAPKVGSIHAYSLPIENLPNYFFLRGSNCWGWGTWVDRWKLFQPDPSNLLRCLFKTGQVDSFCASQGDQSLLMLARRARGRNNSWAILWHATLFLENRLTLYPGKSFVTNIGCDGSGIHSASSDVYASSLADAYEGLPRLDLVESRKVAEVWSSFLDHNSLLSRSSVLRRLLRPYSRLAARYPWVC